MQYNPTMQYPTTSYTKYTTKYNPTTEYTTKYNPSTKYATK